MATSQGRRRSGLFRWTVDQVYQLLELGLLDDRRVELLDGLFYEIATSPPRAVAIGLTTDVAQGLFGETHSIRVRQPLDLGRRSLPSPELAIVAGTAREFAQAHPRSALLLVEISDSTLRKDRVLKARLYARAGIADYWIVNLNDRQVEVHRNPGPDPSRKGRYRYADVTIVPAEGQVSPLIALEAAIAIADLLP